MAVWPVFYRGIGAEARRGSPSTGEPGWTSASILKTGLEGVVPVERTVEAVAVDA
jgi:hypothetical protein